MENVSSIHHIPVWITKRHPVWDSLHLHMTKLELITIGLFILIIKLQGVSAQPPEIDVFIQVYSSRIIWRRL